MKTNSHFINLFILTTALLNVLNGSKAFSADLIVPSIRLRAHSNNPGTRAEFYIDDVQYYSKYGGAGGGRGINFAVIHENTGELEDIRHFDTWLDGTSAISPLIIDYVNTILDGRIIMTAASDHCSLSPEAGELFVNVFGSKYSQKSFGWDSWAMITKKGADESINEAWKDYERGVSKSVEIESELVINPADDLDPPIGTFSVIQGVNGANNNEATLDLSGITDSGSGMIPGGKMRFSKDGIEWSASQNFEEEKVWYLDRIEGNQTVYAQFRDRDGNWTETLRQTVTFQENFNLDLLVPAFASSTNFGDESVCADDNGNIYLVYFQWRIGVHIMRSNDYGKTWSDPIHIPTLQYRPKITCDNYGHVYVTAFAYEEKTDHDYINISSDYGRTWLNEAIKVSNDGYTYNKICSDGSGNVYLTGDEDDQFIINVSHDHGMTWLLSDIVIDNIQNSYSFDNEDYSIDCSNPNEIYLIWRSLGMWINYSLDAGLTWQPENIMLHDRGNYPQIAVDRSGHVYTSWIYPQTGFDPIYFNVSSDQGRTWLSENILIDDNGHFSTLKMEADQSGHVYLAWRKRWQPSFYPTSFSLYLNRSKDYGQTWLDESIKIDHTPEYLTGSIYATPNVYEYDLSINNQGDVAFLWADNGTAVLGEPTSTDRYSRKPVIDIYLNYSNDYGDSWQKKPKRLNQSYPPSYVFNPVVHVFEDRSVNSFWDDDPISFGSDRIYCDQRSIKDEDFDGLPDGWEKTNGLIAIDPNGDNGANGDPDGDLLTNYNEFINDSHPMMPTIVFRKGWNLISWPKNPESTTTIESQLADVPWVGSIWAFNEATDVLIKVNANNNGIDQEKVMTPTNGYWVYTADVYFLDVDRDVSPEITKILVENWNLVGGVHGGDLPSANEINGIWGWNGKHFFNPNRFSSTKGYFINAISEVPIQYWP